VLGPSFAADEVADAIEALIATYLRERTPGERFLQTFRRTGLAPWRAATDRVRRSTAEPRAASYAD
jgi:sulfite reductase (NADPH) hemoprotein beta-component